MGKPSQRRVILLELLIVVAIIGVLAGLLLPAGTPRKRVYQIRALQEIRQIEAAVHEYESRYGRMPLGPHAAGHPDFTFGTTETNGALVSARNRKLPVIKNATGYVCANNELMAILMAHSVYPNVNHTNNPQQLHFLDAKMVNDKLSHGVGTDLVYRDPWGNPYIITLDVNKDNKARDASYSRATVARNGATGLLGLVQSELNNPDSFEANTTVMVWSIGPDGKADPTISAVSGVNKDNLVSW